MKISTFLIGMTFLKYRYDLFSCTFMCRIFPCGHCSKVGTLFSSLLIWSFTHPHPVTRYASCLSPTFFHNCSTYGALSTLDWDSTRVQMAATNKPGWHFITRGCELREREREENTWCPDMQTFVRETWCSGGCKRGERKEKHRCTETITQIGKRALTYWKETQVRNCHIINADLRQKRHIRSLCSLDHIGDRRHWRFSISVVNWNHVCFCLNNNIGKKKQLMITTAHLHLSMSSESKQQWNLSV